MQAHTHRSQPTAKDRGIFLKKTLTLFWGRLRNGWVGKIFCIVIFADCIGGLKWMWMRDSTHSSLNVNHSTGITWTHMQHTTSEVCVHTMHIPFQLKVKQYHLNVTIESGSVYQFQATGWKRGCVFNLTSLGMLNSSARRTGQRTLSMHIFRISMLHFWSKKDCLSIHLNSWQCSPIPYPLSFLLIYWCHRLENWEPKLYLNLVSCLVFLHNWMQFFENHTTGNTEMNIRVHFLISVYGISSHFLVDRL